jgi:expansin
MGAAEGRARTGRRRAAREPTHRWWAAGSAAASAAVLAAVLGVLLAVGPASAPACAAVAAALTASAPHHGVATFYASVNGGGNCSFVVPPAGNLVVALSPTEYAAAGACGSYVDVAGPRGSVRVKVVDQCPECETGHLDLSREAFARIADPKRGLVPITYRAVANPPPPGPLSFRVKEGSSRWWLAVLVDNHGDRLTRVEVSTGGRWQPLVRQDYNYWIAQSGLGPGPFTIRVSDLYGHRAVVSGIKLIPGQTQRTAVWMYRTASKALRPTIPADRIGAPAVPPTTAASGTRASPAPGSPRPPGATALAGQVAAPSPTPAPATTAPGVLAPAARAGSTCG